MLVQHLNRRIESTVDSADSRSVYLPASDWAPVVVKERRHAEFFDVIDASLNINSPEELCKWAQNDLQYIFPHGTLMAGIGHIENETAQIHKLITSKFPQQYLQSLQQIGGFNSSPVLVQWLRTRRPVLFEMAAARNCKSAWLDNVARHDLQNMAAHGLVDLNGRTASYFSFSKIPGNLGLRHAKLLDMLVPHLHVALVRALQGEKIHVSRPAATMGLTEREREILHWLGSGKTNLQIALQLNFSENTVKNHVQRILTKLNVKTRAQAMVKVLTPA